MSDDGCPFHDLPAAQTVYFRIKPHAMVRMNSAEYACVQYHTSLYIGRALNPNYTVPEIELIDVPCPCWWLRPHQHDGHCCFTQLPDGERHPSCHDVPRRIAIGINLEPAQLVDQIDTDRYRWGHQ